MKRAFAIGLVFSGVAGLVLTESCSRGAVRPATVAESAASTPVPVVTPPIARTASAAAYAKGRSMAEADINERHLTLKGYGRREPWYDDYARALKRRYGVELVAVAGCVVDGYLVSEVRGYNDVVTARIEQRFGRGVLDRLSREVERRYWRRHPAKSN